MSGSKHFKQRKPSDADLRSDPGIGQSKGLDRAIGPDELEGENTGEGDVANDTTRFGGVNPNQRGRVNK